MAPRDDRLYQRSCVRFHPFFDIRQAADFADFTGQQLFSHGGALLPREAKKNSPKLVQRLAACLPIRAWSVMRILPRLSSGWPPAHFAQARGVKN